MLRYGTVRFRFALCVLDAGYVANGAGKASGIFILEKHVVCVEFLENFSSVLFWLCDRGFCENDMHLKCYVCFRENLYFLRSGDREVKWW